MIDLSELSLSRLTELSADLGGLQAWVPRDEQRPPSGEWFLWFYRAGRGAGKTRSAAETVSSWIQNDGHRHAGGMRIALVGPRFSDVRDTMVEGESGLLAVLPPFLMPHGRDTHWNRSIGELHLADGTLLKAHSSEIPGRLRGPQWHKAWIDEPAEFGDAPAGITGDTTFFNLLAGLRLGDSPQVVVTGTPKPSPLVRELVERCSVKDTWVESRGTTFDNLDNLAPAFRDEVVRLYEGTRLGRQELLGDLLHGGGDVFDVDHLSIEDSVPRVGGRVWRARCWDLAATEPNEGNRDPDFTVGALVSVSLQDMVFVVEDVVRMRLRPGARDLRIRAIAEQDVKRHGRWVRYFFEEEPGSGGKAQIAGLDRLLADIVTVRGFRPGTGRRRAADGRTGKAQRSDPVSAALDQGRLRFLSGDWNSECMAELADFTSDDAHQHDDFVDALSMFFAVAPTRRWTRVHGPVGDKKLSNFD